MSKTYSSKSKKNIRGEASEIIGIMAIVCCLSLERRLTPYAKNPSTIVSIYKDEKFLNFLRKAYAYDPDLSILASNFGAFVRVIEKVASGT